VTFADPLPPDAGLLLNTLINDVNESRITEVLVTDVNGVSGP
jgi:hypothetical protein